MTLPSFFRNAAAFALVCATAISVEGATIIVSSQANIFGAGHYPPNDTPAPSGGGGGIASAMFSLPAEPGQVIIFPKVTGTMNCGPVTKPNGPDGGNFSYEIASYNGISGISAPCCGFLAGVFLDDSEPVTAPPSLDFNRIGTNFAALSPMIGQIFFIGDGRTADGSIQRFVAPLGASRLFLGIPDSRYPGAAPGFYADNTGWFAVTVDVEGMPKSEAAISALETRASPVISAVFSGTPNTEALPTDKTFGYALPDGIGLTHRIEASPDLVLWSQPTNILLYFKDLDSTNFPQRFYRFPPVGN